MSQEQAYIDALNELENEKGIIFPKKVKDIFSLKTFEHCTVQLGCAGHYMCATRPENFEWHYHAWDSLDKYITEDDTYDINPEVKKSLYKEYIHLPYKCRFISKKIFDKRDFTIIEKDDHSDVWCWEYGMENQGVVDYCMVYPDQTTSPVVYTIRFCDSGQRKYIVNDDHGITGTPFDDEFKGPYNEPNAKPNSLWNGGGNVAYEDW